MPSTGYGPGSGHHDPAQPDQLTQVETRCRAQFNNGWHIEWNDKPSRILPNSILARWITASALFRHHYALPTVSD